MTLGAIALTLLVGTTSLADLVATAKKSTVRVDIEFAPQQGAPPQRVVAGSGVVVGKGLIATCAHLFDDLPGPAKRILVVSNDGGQELTATLEPSSNLALDLAYLKVAGLGMPPAVTASEEPRMGDEVFFVGHPFALSQPVLGVGAVASDEMDVPAGKYVRKLRLLHASANKGNSGGGVFRRSDGHLVGIIQIKTGAVGSELRTLMTTRYSASMAISGVDPIKVLQFVISEMDNQLNMGVAGFLSVKRILPKTP